MVQSTSALNPYTNPDGALARRNLVLDTMIENLPDKADELRAAKAQPLGVLPQAQRAAAGLHRRGRPRVLLRLRAAVPGRARASSKEDVARNGYLIRTTLDPKVQDSVKNARSTKSRPPRSTASPA